MSSTEISQAAVRVEDLTCVPTSESVSQKLLTYGIALLPQRIPDQMCRDALEDVIHSWHEESDNYVAKGRKRLHHKLNPTETILSLIQYSLRNIEQALCNYLSDPDPKLVELSSITSFPGATRQRPHREYNHWPARIQIRLFANLTNVDEDLGPMNVIPGSCFNGKNNFEEDQITPLSLPKGSVIIKDVNTIHWGEANRSESSFRPLVYFGFGKGDGRDVNWYIKDSIKDKFRFSNLMK